MRRLRLLCVFPTVFEARPVFFSSSVLLFTGIESDGFCGLQPYDRCFTDESSQMDFIPVLKTNENIRKNREMTVKSFMLAFAACCFVCLSFFGVLKSLHIRRREVVRTGNLQRDSGW